MEVSMPTPAGRQLVEKYGDGGFQISGVRHTGSVITLPEITLPWSVTTFSEMTLDSLKPVLDHEPKIEVLLVGCGDHIQFIPKDIRAALKEAGIGVDPMDTGAGCRTFNVLMTEDRRAAAALIAID